MMTPMGATAAFVTRTTESRKNGSGMPFFATRKIDFVPGASSANAEGKSQMAASRKRIRTPPSYAPARRASVLSVLHAVGDFSAVLGDLLHHRLVQRDVLLGAPIRARVHVELAGELLACAEARIEVQQLQEVDDRLAVVAAAAFLRGELREHRVDVHVL